MKWATILLFAFTIGFLPSKIEADCMTSSPSPMKDFKVESVFGTWYEYKSRHRGYKTQGKCSSYEFAAGMLRDSESVHMKVSELVNSHEVLYYALLTRKNKFEPSGRFKMTHFLYYRAISTNKLEWTKDVTLFSVLGTDSVCWAVIYTCDDGSFATFERLTLLTRTRDGLCIDSNGWKKVNEALGQVRYKTKNDSGETVYKGVTKYQMPDVDQHECDQYDQTS